MPKSFFLVNYVHKNNQTEHEPIDGGCQPWRTLSFTIISKLCDQEVQNIREAEQLFLDKPTLLVETFLEDLEKTIQNTTKEICEATNRFYANVLLMNKKDMDSGWFSVNANHSDSEKGGYDRWAYEGYHTFDDAKLRVFAADDSLIPRGNMVLLYKGEETPYDGPATVKICSDSMWFSTVQDADSQDIFGSYVRWIRVTDA